MADDAHEAAEVEAAARMRIRYLSTWSALLGKEVQVQLFGESS